jgi:hypothetical protein
MVSPASGLLGFHRTVLSILIRGLFQIFSGKAAPSAVCNTALSVVSESCSILRLSVRQFFLFLQFETEKAWIRRLGLFYHLW